MDLSANMQSLIGHLRSLFFLSLISQTNNPVFPLNAQMRESASRNRRQLEHAISLVCDLAQATDVYQAIAEALDELLQLVPATTWDQEAIFMQLRFLSLLTASIQSKESYSFDNLDTLRRELAPIATHQLQSLLLAVVWERTAFYQYYQHARLYPNPSERFLRLTRLLCDLTPVQSAVDPQPFLVSVFRTWLSLPPVQECLRNNQTHESLGVQHVATELVYAFPDLSYPGEEV
jgi:hypothetical protein